MEQVISAAISSHPVALSGAEKIPPSLSSIAANVKLSRPLKYRRYQRLCCRGLQSNIRNNGMLLLRNQHCLVHALPLQAVTTDNDSEGSSTSPGPSSSVEYAGIYQADKDGRRSLLYYIRVWYTTAKTQNVSVSIQQVLERSKSELQTVDKRQVLQQIKSSKLATFGIHWWESSQPWIKWPIAIFLPWFLLVSIFYGTSASKDLLPLWTMGPLCAGLGIKASIQLVEAYRQWAADRKLKEALIMLIEGFRTGQLPRQLVERAGTRLQEVKQRSFEKKEEIERLFQSGEYKAVLREYADTKIIELREACIDKYEDWRLVYLYLERKVKNII